MEIQSLEINTDLHINRFSGTVTDKGDYIVVHTPSNPGYYYGNYLVFNKPPGKNDYEKWMALFKKEIYDKNHSNHVLFRWDTIIGDTGYVSKFKENNFDIEENILLSTHVVNQPLHYNTEITIRVLKTDSEWEMAINNQILCRDENTSGSLPDFTKFKQKQFEQYRLMCKNKLCEWFGVFIKDQLVADMGVFLVNGAGHFDNVGTAPEFRRQGICGSAIYKISKQYLDSKKAHTLMMVADENYHAARIYESVGFQPNEKTVCLLNQNYFSSIKI